jgi:CRP-like cAMP-binding protein
MPLRAESRADTGAPADLSAAALKALVADNPTFDRFDADQFESLRHVVREVRQIEAGGDLLHEGDLADSIFIIETGRFEVLKKEEEDGLRVHGIAVLRPGMSVGEIALLDAGARSATVRALEPARVLVIPIAALEPGAEPPLPIGLAMKLALGRELARRLRIGNEVTVRSLRAALRESEIRASMGRLMCRLLIGATLYMFALGFILQIKPYLATTTPISVVILLAFATSCIVNIKTSGFPASAYGFNTRNWRGAVEEAILLSLPVAALMVLAKAIMIHTVPAMAGLPLLDLARSSPLGGWIGVLAITTYALFVPVQEVIARSVQSAMMLYLRGRFRVALAILLAALLFSATHLHTSLGMAVAVFPLGLFWGWLYWRNPTLIGVTLSHLLLGLFAFRVVGFPS